MRASEPKARPWPDGLGSEKRKHAASSAVEINSLGLFQEPLQWRPCRRGIAYTRFALDPPSERQASLLTNETIGQFLTAPCCLHYAQIRNMLQNVQSIKQWMTCAWPRKHSTTGKPCTRFLHAAKRELGSHLGNGFHIEFIAPMKPWFFASSMV